jgi:hypothetical protein
MPPRFHRRPPESRARGSFFGRIRENAGKHSRFP